MEHLYHFELNQDPFQNEPDLRFLCASDTHRRAQLRVDRALRQNKGLVVLVGEAGTGKTLLARSIFEELEEEVFEASLLMMMQGTADAVSVLRRLCAQLGMEEPPAERAPLLAAVYEQLAIVREDGRHAVLIIDDAHVLGRDAMAEIGGLLNLEYEDRRLVSLLLVGSPELDDIVAAVPSLGDRVDVRVQVEPLSEGESSAYVAHRLQVAGGTPGIFDAGAMKAIHALGGGRPRRMNTLADNALFEAFLGGRKQVGEDDVRRACADLSSEGLSKSAADLAPAVAPMSSPGPTVQPVAEPAGLAVPSESADMPAPFAAATELAMESFEAPGFGSDAPAPEAVASGPNVLDGLAAAEPSGLSTGELDLADLLGDDSAGLSHSGFVVAEEAPSAMGELELDSPIDPGDSAEDSFPSFTAKNSGGPVVESTRLALPDESFAEPSAQTETTDADEIDDLFVELLDD